MVKKKRTAPGHIQEDKRSEDVMTQENPHEGNEVGTITLSRTRSQNQTSRLAAGGNAANHVNGGKEDGSVAEKVTNRQPNVPQRTSCRVAKRPKRDASPQTVTSTPAQNATSKKSAVTKQNSEQAKTRRSWELWSAEDKDSFFEAICEFGKDFENIQMYIAQKNKKKGLNPNGIKNKDQVRHFYYRTWHNIAKYLDIGDDVKKNAQELYGLINYAELRKRIGGCLNDKNKHRLNELVFSGVTIVKYKGKKLRIKTPVCRALKKLNNVEDNKDTELPKLPSEICLEFRPSNNSAWIHVQSLAQNPRVRTKVSLQTRLSTVIETLQKRWKPVRLKQKEQILASLTSSPPPNVQEEKNIELRVKPCIETRLAPVTINAADTASNTDICLGTYKKNVQELASECPEGKCKKNTVKLKSKSAVQKAEENISKEEVAETFTSNDAPDHRLSEDPFFGDNTTVSERDPGMEVLTPEDEAQKSLSLLKSMLEPMDDDIHGILTPPSSFSQEQDILQKPKSPMDCRAIEELCLPPQEDASSLTLGQLLGLAAGGSLEAPVSQDAPVDQVSTETPEVQVGQEQKENKGSEKKVESKNEDAKQVKDTAKEKAFNGWTAKEADVMTVGELYLKLGCPVKIVLEYEFVPAAETSSSNIFEQQFSGILRKLLNLASVIISDAKSKQAPLSPPGRGNHVGKVVTTPPSGKAVSGRACGRSPTVRSTPRLFQQHLNGPCKSALSSETDGNTSATVSVVSTPVVTATTVTITDSKGTSVQSDQHVFVVPMGTAPRALKPGIGTGSSDSIHEHIDTLLPAHRRTNRQRHRKSLVVKRPLLPRDGVGPGRPMTVVHLVSSGSPIATVVPNTAATLSSPPTKVSIPQAKKIVKLVPATGIGTSPAFDVCPVPVPLLNTVGSTGTGNVVLPTSALSATHVVVETSTANTVLPPTAVLERALSTEAVHPLPVKTVTTTTGFSPVVTAVPAVVLSEATENPDTPVTISKENESDSASLQSLFSSASLTMPTITVTTDNNGMPPQISIPETTSSTSSISPPSISNISSLLDISLNESIAADISMPVSGPLVDFAENSNSSLSSAFGLSSSKKRSSKMDSGSDLLTSSKPALSTPPHSPSSSTFKLNSPGPESHWLNGESSDFSLSSLLNTLDSPSKTPASSSSSTPVLTTENSMLDPITRLAPDVDTQLQCLMNENSVDYVAKFADLAAQIASTSNIESKST